MLTLRALCITQGFWRSLYRSTLVFSFVCSQMYNVMYSLIYTVLFQLYLWPLKFMFFSEYCFNFIPWYYITNRAGTNEWHLRSVLSFHERWGLWSSLSVLYTKHYTSVHINKNIAEAAKCSTKPLSWFLILIHTVVKTDIHKYHDLCFSRFGIKPM
jgi:hypothetical protein